MGSAKRQRWPAIRANSLETREQRVTLLLSALSSLNWIRMSKQSYEIKAKACGEKFKAIREGRFKRGLQLQHLGVALRRDSKGNVYLENMINFTQAPLP